MPRPQTRNGWNPTGNTRHRFTAFGRMVLQLEEQSFTVSLTFEGRVVSRPVLRWRDARSDDMHALEYAIRHRNDNSGQMPPNMGSGAWTATLRSR